MQGRKAVKLGIAVLLAALPCYLVERITEYYFLSGNATVFYEWSGQRTPIFIALVLLAAVASGYVVGDLRAAAIAYTIGIVLLLSLLYSFCIPKVCYSVGPDGFEPLRVGYFFSCLGIVGASMGDYCRTKVERRGPALFVISAATIGAIAYYPVVFTVAGTRLIAPLAPVPILVIVAFPSLVFAGRIAQSSNWKVGFTIPVLADLLMLAVTIGIARQYLPQVATVASLIVIAGAVGASIGCTLALKSRSPPSHVPKRLVQSNSLLYAALFLALISTAVFLPDAAAGVTPLQPSEGPSSSFAIGPSAYAGGFATQSIVRPEAVSVAVSFAGTNASSIEADNFLSGGLGVHSAHCCTDGIDFGYRFDAYLFHDGSEALVATAWEVCDWNIACGGHSWQNLMFFSEERLNTSLDSNVRLVLQWVNTTTVVWSFSIDQGALTNFTSFDPPPQDNPYFIVGTQGNIPDTPVPPQAFSPSALINIFPSPTSSGFYYFQYGIMSRYPIEHSGWRVSFTCPSYIEGGNWKCLDHSDSIQGDQSYWKAIWRWGVPYDNVIATSNEAGPSVAFSYSASSTMPSFSRLW